MAVPRSQHRNGARKTDHEHDHTEGRPEDAEDLRQPPSPSLGRVGEITNGRDDVEPGDPRASAVDGGQRDQQTDAGSSQDARRAAANRRVTLPLASPVKMPRVTTTIAAPTPTPATAPRIAATTP